MGTKRRSEVRGGGKKPYQQKKRGSARRGSSRAPIIRGGGVIFGPKPRELYKTMINKERKLAISTALQNASNIMTVIKAPLLIETPKTKMLFQKLMTFNVEPGVDKLLILTQDRRPPLIQTTNNIESLTISTVSSLKIIDILSVDKIILEINTLTKIIEMYGLS